MANKPNLLPPTDRKLDVFEEGSVGYKFFELLSVEDWHGRGLSRSRDESARIRSRTHAGRDHSKGMNASLTLPATRN